MPKFVVGDVVRVLRNEGDATVRVLDKFIGRVGLVTEANPGWYKIGAFDTVWWFRNDEAEIAQIQVGDRVITEKFEEGGENPMFPKPMHDLVGEVGTVIVVYPPPRNYIRVEHGRDKAWSWPRSAVKFALEGDVPVAPQQAPVEAPDALPEPPKAKAKKPAKEKHAIIKNLRAELNKKCKSGAGTASYAIEFKDHYVRWQVRDICHARIGIQQDWRGAGKETMEHGPVTRITTAVQPFASKLKGVAKDNYQAYVDYIVKRSPYADCFLPVKIPTRYSVYMNLKRSIHNIASACIALREGSEEMGGKVSTFAWLLKQGVSEDAAWVVSRFFHPVGHKEGGEYSFCASSGHDAISAHTDVAKFFKVFKDGLYLNDEPYNKAAKATYNVYACFGCEDKYGACQQPNYLSAHLKEVSGYKEIKAGWNTKEIATADGVIAAAKWVDEQIAIARA